MSPIAVFHPILFSDDQIASAAEHSLIEELILPPFVDRLTHTLSCSRRFYFTAWENTRTVSDWTPQNGDVFECKMFSLFSGEWVMGRDYRTIGAELPSVMRPTHNMKACSVQPTDVAAAAAAAHCQRHYDWIAWLAVVSLDSRYPFSNTMLWMI